MIEEPGQQGLDVLHRRERLPIDDGCITNGLWFENRLRLLILNGFQHRPTGSVNSCLEGTSMHFTIANKGHGLIDQLDQIRCLHGLGRLLGYQYIHSPLADSAHGFIGKHLNDFLGLGIGERRIDDPRCNDWLIREVEVRRIVGSAEAFSRPSELRTTIERQHGSGPRHLYRLVWTWDLRERCQPLLDRQSDPFGFCEKYWQRRQSWPVEGLWDDAPIKVVLHLRYGDIVWIPFRGKYIYCSAVHDSLQTTGNYPHVDASQLIEFLETLYGVRDPALFSVLAFSDGYDFAWKKIQELKVDSTERAELEQTLRHREREPAALGELPRVRLFVAGEMFKAVHAFASADVVVRSAGAFAHGVARTFNPNPGKCLVNIQGIDVQSLLRRCDEVLESRDHGACASGG